MLVPEQSLTSVEEQRVVEKVTDMTNAFHMSHGHDPTGA